MLLTKPSILHNVPENSFLFITFPL